MCDHLSWATTYSKHQNLPSQSPVAGTFRKQPPHVSDRDHDHVSGWRFNNFPCKRLFDAVCSFLFRVWEKLLSTTWNYTYCKLETACHKLSSIKKYVTDIFTEETPCGSILENDHFLIFAFWVAAYRRFDCNFFFCSIPLSLGASQVWISIIRNWSVDLQVSTNNQHLCCLCYM